MIAPAASTAAPSVLAHSTRAGLRSRGLLNGRVLFGGALVLIVVVLAVVGMMWTPYPVDAPNVNARFLSPQWHHLLGTDELGRDVFSRAMAGARASLIIAVCAVGIAAVIGTVVGFLTGYLRGAVDIVLSRIIDAMLAIPALVVALGVVAMLGASATSVTIALAAAYTPTFSRVFRGVIVAARDQMYVEASRGLGLPAIVVIVKDLLPSVLPIMVVQVTTSLAWGILDEANLGFLGLGIQPPAPSWGSLLIEGRQYMYEAPWLPIGAGALVVFAVLGVNTLGDGLRDVLDPRAWTRRHSFGKRGAK